MPPKVKQMIREQEEQKIFKEFEELGYEIDEIKGYNICLYKYYEKYDEDYAIIIDLKNKCYYCECMDVVIDMKIHQLLHKLFKLWGWFDE